MNYCFQEMTQENALIIANDWKYPGIYAFYDFDADPEDYEKLIDAQKRGDNYYQVLLDNELIGFLCYTLNHSTAEIGIGMKPDLTGKGLGYDYLENCIAYILSKHKNVDTFSLIVAQFNKRAIKVYERLGFEKVSSFENPTNGGVYPFISMKKDLTLKNG